MKLYEKLHKIQEHVMGLAKNKQGMNYQYVTGEKVLQHVKPLMNELGIILKQEIISIDNERMDYKVGAGTPKERAKVEILSKVMMRFTWIDCKTGEKDENLFGANGQNDFDKGVGSALTYGERYFLLKYFHIATDEDDIDNPERKKQDAIQAAKPKIEKPVNDLTKQVANCKSVDELNALYKSLEATTPLIIQMFANRKKELSK